MLYYYFVITYYEEYANKMQLIYTNRMVYLKMQADLLRSSLLPFSVHQCIPEKYRC